eukprot:207403_1
MTGIIGFISYFLYDYAIGLESLHFYIMYKAMSFIGFLISGYFVYIVSINVSKPKAKASATLGGDEAPHNPYTSSTSTGNIAPRVASKDELYFTTKSMLNRMSSQVLNTQNEKKLDYNSSPQKIESLDPTQIATHENLNKFIEKQAQSKAFNTPIGKTFGSMHMTPAGAWSTPSKGINNTNQGSAGIYTPASSMDVTMMSYDEPFAADFSVIEPKAQLKGQHNPNPWAISNQMRLNDVSTIAQPGTPMQRNYVYDAMYSDMNLRGDNIATANTAQPRKEGQEQMRMRMQPLSPFSRKRRVNTTASKSTSVANDFDAFYMEKSIVLYESLRVDGLIENWAESMRWWLSQHVLKTRAGELVENDAEIENQIFGLLCAQPYNLKQQLSELQNPLQKEHFIISNEQQLLNVARQENKPGIQRIIQKRKHLCDCIQFMTRNYNECNAKEYVHRRIATLSSTNNLTLYQWNGGSKQYRFGAYPTDAEVVMTLFCRYMDDVMCPAIKFSQKHYIQISSADINKTHKLYKKFKDIAIICVNDNTQKVKKNGSLPYFFIAYNRKKFEHKSSLIRKPRHFLGNNQSMDEQKELEALPKGHHYKHDVGTWFPQPGKMNLIHTITLFALFIHRHSNDKLTGIALKDQGCTLLQPLVR